MNKDNNIYIVYLLINTNNNYTYLGITDKYPKCICEYFI